MTPTPSSSHRNYSLLARLCALFLGSAPTLALAQLTHADLSVNAVLTPPYFIPGRRNTVALTVHNAGPDALDIHPPYSIDVGGESYIVTFQPPPYEVIVPADGCAVERFVTDALLDGNIALQFAYYFDILPAGASRTCTYEIEFYPSTQAPLNLEWQANTWYVLDNIDPNPSNNTFSYTLTAAPSVSPTPIPAGSLMGWLMLGFGLVLSVAIARSRSIFPRSAVRCIRS